MRLPTEITQKQLQLLETAAEIEGKSVEDCALERALPNPAEQKPSAQLESLLTVRAKSAETGKFSNKSLDRIFDEELKKATTEETHSALHHF